MYIIMSSCPIAYFVTGAATKLKHLCMFVLIIVEGLDPRIVVPL